MEVIVTMERVIKGLAPGQVLFTPAHAIVRTYGGDLAGIRAGHYPTVRTFSSDLEASQWIDVVRPLFERDASVQEIPKGVNEVDHVLEKLFI